MLDPPLGSVLGLRPPGLEFRILCLEGSVILIISPSSGGSPGPQRWPKARFISFPRPSSSTFSCQFILCIYIHTVHIYIQWFYFEWIQCWFGGLCIQCQLQWPQTKSSHSFTFSLRIWSVLNRHCILIIFLHNYGCFCWKVMSGSICFYCYIFVFGTDTVLWLL